MDQLNAERIARELEFPPDFFDPPDPRPDHWPDNPELRRAEFDRRVAIAYDNAKAVNAGMGGGLDDVIDPATTRDWIASGLRRLPPVAPRTEKKYPFVDTW